MSHIPPPHSAQRPDHSPTPSVPPATTSVPADRRALLAGIGGLAAGALLAGARSAHAGPLDPPPGPINPTGVTLGEIAERTALPSGIAEPRRPYLGGEINQPGSYYLVGNLSDIIFINATDVFLDLCGFVVQGANPGAGVAAIECYGSADRILIRNGRIDARNFIYGVLSGVAASVTLEDLEINGTVLHSISAGVAIQAGTAICRRVSVTNFRSGISIPAGIIDDCHTVGCPAGLGNGSGIIRRSSVRGSGQFTGISVGANSAVLECQVSSSGASASIRTGAASLVDQCVVSGGRPGIATGDNSAILRCVVRGAQGVGIDVAGFSRVADCSVTGTTAVAGGDPGVGVRGSQRLRLERSTIANSAAQGVRCTSFDAAISDCSILVNSGVGIECVGPAMIDRCHLANNNGGMFFDALTRVSQCHLDFNGPYGIWATSTTIGGTFIVDCDITRHGNGVDIRTATGSGVFRSRFAGNTTNIIAPAGNFTLIVFGPAAAGTATNPNINIAL